MFTVFQSSAQGVSGELAAGGLAHLSIAFRLWHSGLCSLDCAPRQTVATVTSWLSSRNSRIHELTWTHVELYSTISINVVGCL